MPELTMDSFFRDGGKIKKERQPRHYWQWYWDYDYLGDKYKAIYYGPKLDWMKVYKEKKKWKKK
jgi:hypothetical protein